MTSSYGAGHKGAVALVDAECSERVVVPARGAPADFIVQVESFRGAPITAEIISSAAQKRVKLNNQNRRSWPVQVAPRLKDGCSAKVTVSVKGREDAPCEDRIETQVLIQDDAPLSPFPNLDEEIPVYGSDDFDEILLVCAVRVVL